MSYPPPNPYRQDDSRSAQPYDRRRDPPRSSSHSLQPVQNSGVARTNRSLSGTRPTAQGQAQTFESWENWETASAQVGPDYVPSTPVGQYTGRVGLDYPPPIGPPPPPLRHDALLASSSHHSPPQQHPLPSNIPQSHIHPQLSQPPAQSGRYQSSSPHSSTPVPMCRYPNCHLTVTIDERTRELSEYCSLEHMRDHLLRGVPLCPACKKCPRRVNGLYCGSSCEKWAAQQQQLQQQQQPQPQQRLQQQQQPHQRQEQLRLRQQQQQQEQLRLQQQQQQQEQLRLQQQQRPQEQQQRLQQQQQPQEQQRLQQQQQQQQLRQRQLQQQQLQQQQPQHLQQQHPQQRQPQPQHLQQQHPQQQQQQQAQQQRQQRSLSTAGSHSPGSHSGGVTWGATASEPVSIPVGAQYPAVSPGSPPAIGRRVVRCPSCNGTYEPRGRSDHRYGTDPLVEYPALPPCPYCGFVRVP